MDLGGSQVVEGDQGLLIDLCHPLADASLNMACCSSSSNRACTSPTPLGAVDVS